MIAIDTNVLVQAHRRDAVWHEAAARAVADALQGAEAVLLPWPCLHEFVAVVTARIYDPPSTLAQALAQLDAWLASPVVTVRGEGPDHLDLLRALAVKGKVSGARIHDARVAAICLGHGARELLTADRDFSRFPGLVTRNPLIV